MVFSICGAVILGWVLAMAPKMKRPAAAGERLTEDDDETDSEPLQHGEPRQRAPGSEASDGGVAAAMASAGMVAPRARRQGAATGSSVASPASQAEGAAEPEAPSDHVSDGGERGVKREAQSPRESSRGGARRRANQDAPKRDHVNSNRMLSLLRNQRDGQDPVKAAAAVKALDLYKNLEWDEKESMVTRFKENKTRGCMKWLEEWVETRSKSDDTILGWNENWHGPGQILKILGYQLSDFETREKARERVEKDVLRNQIKFNTLQSHPPRVDEDDWLSSEYFWVADNGKTRRVAPPPPPALPRSLAREQGGEGDIAGQDRGAGAGPPS